MHDVHTGIIFFFKQRGIGGKKDKSILVT